MKPGGAFKLWVNWMQQLYIPTAGERGRGGGVTARLRVLRLHCPGVGLALFTLFFAVTN
jgi:hypothetical protein